MDKTHADTVRLLLAVTPAVFDGDIFAMKGGTAINLFIQEMPRVYRSISTWCSYLGKHNETKR
jgi:hypothetical protein